MHPIFFSPTIRSLLFPSSSTTATANHTSDRHRLPLRAASMSNYNHSHLGASIRFHRGSATRPPPSPTYSSTTSSTSSSSRPPPRQALLTWMKQTVASLKANPALAALTGVSVASALYFYAQNRKLASSSYLLPKLAENGPNDLSGQFQETMEGEQDGSQGLAKPSAPSDGGWKVLRDQDGEKQMEFSDGKGSRGYFYSRSWGGKTAPDGSWQSWGNPPPRGGTTNDSSVYEGPDVLHKLLEDQMREMDQMFQGVLGGRGGFPRGLLNGLFGFGGGGGGVGAADRGNDSQLGGFPFSALFPPMGPLPPLAGGGGGNPYSHTNGEEDGDPPLRRGGGRGGIRIE